MNKKLYIPLFIVFLDILWFSFILPSVPFIIKSFWFDSVYVWIIIWLTALWMLLGGILFWKLSDIFNRKIIILLSIIINIIWYILFWLANNLIIFAIARFLNWIWWWWISVIQAYVWDISKENEKIKNIWYIWASFWLWFLLWPIFWYFLISKNLNQIWYYSAFLLFCALIICVFFFKNSNHQETIKKNEFKMKKMISLFLISFSITFTLIWIQTIFPFFLKNFFNFWMKQIYLIFWFISVIAIIYQIFILKIIEKKIKEENILKIWLIWIILSLFILFFNNNFFILLFSLAIFSIWLVNVNNTLFSIIISYSNKNEFWKNLWLSNWFWSIGEIFWALISWYLYSIWTKIPFLIFIIFITISLLIFIFNFNEKKIHNT